MKNWEAVHVLFQLKVVKHIGSPETGSSAQQLVAKMEQDTGKANFPNFPEDEELI